MKKYLLILIVISVQLYAVTEEQYREFINDIKIKIGIHTYFNNIDYNGKYLVNYKDSRFYNTDLNNQYKLNNHFSSGFNVEFVYNKYSIEYNLQFLENNFSTPSPIWAGGVHKDAYKVIRPNHTIEDSLFGLENSNRTHTFTIGYHFNEKCKMLIDFNYLTCELSNNYSYNDGESNFNMNGSNHEISILGLGSKFTKHIMNDRYNFSLSPILYPFCRFSNKYEKVDELWIDTSGEVKYGYGYLIEASVSTNINHLNGKLGYKIQHLVQDKNFSMFTRGVTFEASWTF